MKKKLLMVLFLSVPGSLKASPVALVYESEENVLRGISIIGTVVDGGIVITADKIPISKNSFYAASLGEPLRSATLVRFDLQLNTAFLKWGEVVPSSLVQEAHQQRAASLKTFLPQSNAKDNITAPSLLASASAGPFQLKINNEPLGDNVIVLPSRLKKSKFKMDIVNMSTVPVWGVEVELKSDPKLSFWKEGRKMDLNDVPQTTFRTSQQILFRPLAEGKSIKVPVEVFFINQEDYVWTFVISSKGLKMEQKVKIKFKS